MSTTEKLRQAHLQEWAPRFADQKASGLTVRQWCEQNNVSIHKYNYWKHQLKEELVDQMLPDIVPLSLPQIKPVASEVYRTNRANLTNFANHANSTNRTTIHLSINGFSIDLDSSVPEDFLFTLLRAARYA